MTRSKLIRTCLSCGIGMGLILAASQPALSAERIDFIYGPLLFSLPLDDLEAYVERGEITPAFALYANQMDEATLSQLRQMLQRPYEMDETAVYRMTQTPMVADLLNYLGEFINTASGQNGFYAIRGALVLAAAEPGDWSMLDVMHHFPTNIRINLDAASPFMDAGRSPTTTSLPEISNGIFNLLY